MLSAALAMAQLRPSDGQPAGPMIAAPNDPLRNTIPAIEVFSIGQAGAG